MGPDGMGDVTMIQILRIVDSNYVEATYNSYRQVWDSESKEKLSE